MSNLIKYGSYEPEAAVAEQAELAKASGDFMKLAVGRNVVRFLPPPMGKKSPFVMVHQHFINLPGMEAPYSFACPRLMIGRACPVCQKIDQLRASGNPADYDLAGEMLPSLRVFCNVIDRANEEMGPRKLAIGKKIHEALVGLRQDSDAGGDYTHPETGFDIIIARVGTGKNDTKYTVMPARQSTPLAADAALMQEWIDSQADLMRFALVPSYEEIVQNIGGLVAPPRAVQSVGRTVPQQRQAAPQQRAPQRPAAAPKARTAEDDAFQAPPDMEQYPEEAPAPRRR